MTVAGHVTDLYLFVQSKPLMDYMERCIKLIDNRKLTPGDVKKFSNALKTQFNKVHTLDEEDTKYFDYMTKGKHLSDLLAVMHESSSMLNKIE